MGLGSEILAQCNSGIPGYQGPIDTSGNPFLEALCNPSPNLDLELLKTEAFLKDRGYLQEK